nr:MAG TPA: hypothetical protein [Bacteriophage sp.]
MSKLMDASAAICTTCLYLLLRHRHMMALLVRLYIYLELSLTIPTLTPYKNSFCTGIWVIIDWHPVSAVWTPDLLSYFFNFRHLLTAHGRKHTFQISHTLLKGFLIHRFSSPVSPFVIDPALIL